MAEQDPTPPSAQATPASHATSALPGAADGEREAGSPAADSNPARRPKKRRRRGRGRAAAQTAPSSARGEGGPSPRSTLDPGLAALAGGLLSHIDDREVACTVEGCSQTWTWTAAEQIQAYGQPPPRRECAACTKTKSVEVRCAVDGCVRTWTWRSGGRNARPPRRACKPCQEKRRQLADRASVCKVHGCTRPVVIDREAQLRAWARLKTSDLDAEAPLPKQMCGECREFFRSHKDRAVACSRPGCERTWTFKRGAQLQAFLAGRFEDPVRLCAACEREARRAQDDAGTASERGAPEVMPCIVPGCSGVWHHRADASLVPCEDGEQPVERMCDRCRVGATEPRLQPQPT